MNQNFTKLAYTQSVKDAQEQYGSRRGNAAMEASGDRFVLTDREIPFIQARDTLFMATVGENGWPYMQHRGGPPGFLKVIDETTLAMADYRGNRQYISVGNINSSGRIALFLIDYPSRNRLKIWAEAEVLESSENPEMFDQVSDPAYGAAIERLMVFKVQAYDWNCQQHITPRFTHEEIRQGLAQLEGP